MEQQCRNEEGRSLSLRARSDTAAAAQKREEILHDNGKTMFEQIGLSVLCRSVLESGILDLVPGMAGDLIRSLLERTRFCTEIGRCVKASQKVQVHGT